MPKHAITVKPYNGLFYFKCSCGHTGIAESNEELAMKHGLDHVGQTAKKIRVVIDTNQFVAEKLMRQLSNIEGTLRLEN